MADIYNVHFCLVSLCEVVDWSFQPDYFYHYYYYYDHALRKAGL
jgi:hypothetical protein